MSTKTIQSLNRDIANDHETVKYPYVEVLEPSDCIALILPSIEAGDLPVLCTFEGKRRQIGKIRKSALTLSALNSVTKLSFHRDAFTSIDINGPKECLEVLM